jgi:hypothetical protein
LWFISDVSPAIDSATGMFDYVVDDFTGQQRIGLKDIGADEYSNHTVTRKPLTPDDVGPFAYETPTSVDIQTDSNLNPISFVLYQNYPNPFNPVTSIQYAIGSRQFVLLKVYDVLGNEIATLVNEEKPAGNYEVEFSRGLIHQTLRSGIYFYELRTDGFVETKKMVLIK